MRITDNGMTWWLAFMAALASISAAIYGFDFVDARISALLGSTVGALQAATAVIVARVKPIGQAEEHAREHAL